MTILVTLCIWFGIAVLVSVLWGKFVVSGSGLARIWIEEITCPFCSKIISEAALGNPVIDENGVDVICPYCDVAFSLYRDNKGNFRSTF